MPTPLIEYYPLLRSLHLSLVSASVLLFSVRGLGVLLEGQWPMRSGWRQVSVAIDTVLMLAGAGLWWMLQHNPLHESWLAAKLLLLPVYVILGSLALKRAPTRRAKMFFYFAALLCVLTMVSMARLRHPAGWWSLLWN